MRFTQTGEQIITKGTLGLLTQIIPQAEQVHHRMIDFDKYNVRMSLNDDVESIVVTRFDTVWETNRFADTEETIVLVANETF